MAKLDPNMIVSSAELAAVLGITERRVQQLEAESVFANVGKGRSKRFVLSAAVQAWKEKSETDARGEAMSALTSREAFEAERARKLKLENDTREALLIETPDAIAGIDYIFGEVRTELAGIPTRHHPEDLTERRRLENDIDKALGGIVARLEKAATAIEAGRDPLAADAADNAG